MFLFLFQPRYRFQLHAEYMFNMNCGLPLNDIRVFQINHSQFLAKLIQIHKFRDQNSDYTAVVYDTKENEDETKMYLYSGEIKVFYMISNPYLDAMSDNYVASMYATIMKLSHKHEKCVQTLITQTDFNA